MKREGNPSPCQSHAYLEPQMYNASTTKSAAVFLSPPGSCASSITRLVCPATKKEAWKEMGSCTKVLWTTTSELAQRCPSKTTTP